MTPPAISQIIADDFASYRQRVVHNLSITCQKTAYNCV